MEPNPQENSGECWTKFWRKRKDAMKKIYDDEVDHAVAVQGLNELVSAIRSISHGDGVALGPEGLEMLSMSISGEGNQSPLGDVLRSLDEHLCEELNTLSGAVEDIARAIEAAKPKDPVVGKFFHIRKSTEDVRSRWGYVDAKVGDRQYLLRLAGHSQDDLGVEGAPKWLVSIDEMIRDEWDFYENAQEYFIDRQNRESEKCEEWEKAYRNAVP
jgi:hypothetical protein